MLCRLRTSWLISPPILPVVSTPKNTSSDCTCVEKVSGLVCGEIMYGRLKKKSCELPLVRSQTTVRFATVASSRPLSVTLA